MNKMMELENKKVALEGKLAELEAELEGLEGVEDCLPETWRNEDNREQGEMFQARAKALGEGDMVETALEVLSGERLMRAREFCPQMKEMSNMPDGEYWTDVNQKSYLDMESELEDLFHAEEEYLNGKIEEIGAAEVEAAAVKIAAIEAEIEAVEAEIEAAEGKMWEIEWDDAFRLDYDELLEQISLKEARDNGLDPDDEEAVRLWYYENKSLAA